MCSSSYSPVAGVRQITSQFPCQLTQCHVIFPTDITRGNIGLWLNNGITLCLDVNYVYSPADHKSHLKHYRKATKDEPFDPNINKIVKILQCMDTT